ncbi:dTDP-4-dehydrorhamnose 3,5-epimerase [Erythrobacter sp. SD-21]|uniref:dTDP-4-dehydrorhamnose 3,5-epimerase n=1 Tax=Erythrobacter sp. SD-21 TaxID=161528 RepID=UPI000153F29D|nr:dTDP-4-dehydrorhamnose 3,5-epimerase [Erythrobacter sp. SD-21]EDL49310.1 dTDP-4-dehydrorhamnose 3,5-epimerase [Erythrobacter sp. SD-21]
MKVHPTKLADAVVIEPQVFGDERGFFLESWNNSSFKEVGLNLDFVQDNHSCSSSGVLRGLHYQLPNPQGKLVRVVRGAVYDVIVDLRRSSPSFGLHEAFEISAANKRILWVPPGFAHGFLTLCDDTHFLYKCTAYYEPSSEHSLVWNDPDLAIDWPLSEGAPDVSDKDRNGITFREAPHFE